MTRRWMVVPAVLAAALTLATPRAARAEFEFTPFVGRVEPMNSAVVDAGDIGLEFHGASLYGARLGTWWTPALGAEATLAFGRANTQLISTGFAEFESRLWTADLRLRVRLNAPTAATNVFLTGGVGVTQWGNTLFDATIGPFRPEPWVTGVLGLGATFPVTDRVTLRADIEDRFHGNEFDIGTGIENEDRLQQDLALTLGVVVPFGGR